MEGARTVPRTRASIGGNRQSLSEVNFQLKKNIAFKGNCGWGDCVWGHLTKELLGVDSWHMETFICHYMKITTTKLLTNNPQAIIPCTEHLPGVFHRVPRASDPLEERAVLGVACSVLPQSPVTGRVAGRRVGQDCPRSGLDAQCETCR